MSRNRGITPTDKSSLASYDGIDPLLGLKRIRKVLNPVVKKMNYLYSKCRVILLLVYTGSWITLDAAEHDAYVVGDVVKIPVLSVGASIYSLDLQLIPNTDPVQLVMVAAQEITLSEVNLSNASSFANNTLTIPTLAAGNASYRIELILVSAEPSVILQLSKVDLIPAEANPSTNSQPTRTQTDFEKAEALFNESIAQPIVQSKCISCHRQGRSAGGTSLVFVRSSATSQGIIIAAFEALLQRRNDGINYILRKVSGNGHGGGTQLAAGSASYNNLSEFLTLLSR